MLVCAQDGLIRLVHGAGLEWESPVVYDGKGRAKNTIIGAFAQHRNFLAELVLD